MPKSKKKILWHALELNARLHGQDLLLFLIAHQVVKNGRPKAKFLRAGWAFEPVVVLPLWEQIPFFMGISEIAPKTGQNLDILPFTHKEAFFGKTTK